jgi:glycine cleavage system H protein
MHPKELLYTLDHVWVKKEPDGNVRLGMTYHYQQMLKKVVYLDLPAAGSAVKRGQPFASFESSKTAADMSSPVSGTVLECNAALADKPGLVNTEPYGAGWMVLVKPSDPSELKGLLNAEQYIDSIVR